MARALPPSGTVASRRVAPVPVMDRLRPPAGTDASRRVAPAWFARAPADPVLLGRVPIGRVPIDPAAIAQFPIARAAIDRVRHVTARPGIVLSVARALMVVEALRVVRLALATGSPGAIATRPNASHQRPPNVGRWK